jgi:hypothetical protein
VADTMLEAGSGTPPGAVSARSLVGVMVTQISSQPPATARE